MRLNKYTMNAVGKIAGGVKSVVAAVFGLIGTGGKFTRDIRFWAEGRDWDFPLGPIHGAAATSTTISFQPQAYFRAEKLMATDTSEKAGFGTAIGYILVGQRLQHPSGDRGTLSAFFGPSALGNGLRFDECPPALSIALTINFIQDCTFYGNLFGRALL
jgi:hypothetical protein